MSPTKEQIIAEAERRWAKSTMSSRSNKTAKDFIIEVIRENWTPPEPVDPDVLAFREWLVEQWPDLQEVAISGETDSIMPARAFLAGARLSREAAAARIKELEAKVAELEGTLTPPDPEPEPVDPDIRMSGPSNDEDMIRLLKEAADKLGYRLSKKPSK